MPSTGIHLLVGYKFNPAACDAFWLGCFAPDYTNDRTRKDHIHLRDTDDRPAGLCALRATADMSDPFALGWLLHLFTDMRWDASLLAQYREAYLGTDAENGGWFLPYRHEIGLASYYIYHHMPWSSSVWAQINTADCTKQTNLPISAAELACYRDRVAQKHGESDPAAAPAYYASDVLQRFACDTAAAFRAWMR